MSETDALLLDYLMDEQSKYDTVRPSDVQLAAVHGTACNGSVDDELLDVVADDPGQAQASSMQLKNLNGGGQTGWGESNEVLPPEHYQYDDFQTIDWLRDMARDRTRHRDIVKRKKKGSYELLLGLWDAASGWLVVLLTGVLSGIIAAIIDIGTPWVSDLKNGICSDGFWFNREQCCWDEDNNTMFVHDEDNCSKWTTWADMFGMAHVNSAATYVVSYIMYVMVAAFFAFISGWLVRMFAPYACGSGIAEIKTILGGFVIHGFLGKWTLLIKCVGLVLAVASGLFLGKEGPMVHIACCVGNILTNLFPKYAKNEAKKREVISASAAAGVAVAFGAPIGGVLFSLEEASYYFPMKTLWRSFFCAMCAAFVLRLINPFGNDHLVVFFIDFTKDWYLIEIIPFLIVGALGGLFGALFIKANLKWCRVRKTTRLGKYPITEVVVLAVLSALLAFPNPYTRKSTSDLIKQLVSHCGPEDTSDLCNYGGTKIFTNVHDAVGSSEIGPGMERALWQLTLALLLKVVLVVFTIGIKVPAGLFIPSLCIGSIMGRLVGIGVEQLALHNSDSDAFKDMCGANKMCVEPGLYAIIGAAAALGGVTRMTVSLVVMMFEVTGAIKYIMPLMVAVMASKWVGDFLAKEGIYEAHIQLNGYPFLDNKEEFPYTTIAADVMRPRRGEVPIAVITQEGMTVEQLDAMVKTTEYNAFPVVVSRESQYLVGIVSKRDLKIALGTAREKHTLPLETRVYFTPQYPANINSTDAPVLKLRKIVDLAPITITDQSPMETVVEMFRKLGLRQTLVTHNGRLLGIITKKDILRHVAEIEKRTDVVH